MSPLQQGALTSNLENTSGFGRVENNMNDKWNVRHLEGDCFEMSTGPTPEKEQASGTVLTLRVGACVSVLLVIAGGMIRFSKNKAPEIVQAPPIVDNTVPHTYFTSQERRYWAEIHGNRVIIFDPDVPDEAKAFHLEGGFVKTSLMGELASQRPEFVDQTEIPTLAGP